MPPKVSEDTAMNNAKINKKTRGFSMIEVLIAVVVLGFGLMALAALQTSIIRSSAETKTQTVALQLAKDKVEDLRSFQTLAGYQALTSGNDTVIESAVNYARTWTVTRFGYQPSVGVFAAIANLTGATPAADGGGVGYTANNEYKRVAVRVTWTDANGASQSIGIEDAIGALSPGDGAKVILNNTATSEPRYPRVLIRDPSLAEGVIPIALGGDASTAATNPRPEVISQDNNSSVVETRFDVLTYKGTGIATVQQRVETAIVGCTCTRSAGTQTAYRPTYWNGFRYVPPKLFASVPVSVPASNVTQSSLCTACCRDHHDPASADGPKYDARRNSHDHYLSSDLATVVNTGNYSESCRMIRVDGIFRTATDTYNDYFNLLETDNSAATTTIADYIPTASSTARYRTFVLDYLRQRFVNNVTPSTYNDSLNATSIAALEDAPTPSINAPASISINESTAPRWLHARGLYIDHLGTEALKLIADIKEDCITNSCTSAVRETRLLSALPFTSINVTEISNWKSTTSANVASTTAIKMDNTIGFASSLNQLAPVKGKVLLGSAPVNAATAKAVADIGPSNSGLALTNPIDSGDVITNVPDSADTTDIQDFVIGATNVVPNPNGGFFWTEILGASEVVVASNFPYVGFNPSTSLTNCAPDGGTLVNPYKCTTAPADALGVATRMTIGNYNREVSAENSTVQPLNTCTSAPNNNNGLLSDRTGMPYQIKYDVISVVSDNGSAVIGAAAVSNANALGPYPTGEYTEVLITPVNASNKISFTLGNKVYLCPSNYPFPSSPSDSQCSGNGNNKVPIWSTTYMACPIGFTVPSDP
jgi:type IV pilus modification protein PilV